MQVLVIGATGGTGNALVRDLLQRGHAVRAMIRDPRQADALAGLGATPVEGDLEGELGGVVDGVDAVAFCAGSGSRTGPDATLRVDLHGAVRVIDDCVAAQGVGPDPTRGRRCGHGGLPGRPQHRRHVRADRW